MDILSNWELTRRIKDLARKCRCSSITIIDVADVVPDLSQPNTFQILSNGEVWFVACNGESVQMDSGATVVVSSDPNNDITIGSDGGAFLDVSVFDTNFFVTNLAQNANRTHDQANFTTVINNVNSFTFDRGAATLLEFLRFDINGLDVQTPSGVNFDVDFGADSVAETISPTELIIRALDGVNTGVLQVEPELIDINSTDGVNTSIVQIAPSSINLNASTGIYYLGDQAGANLPPTEAAPDWVALIDAATGRLEKITPCTLVDDCLGISGGGNPALFLNEQGDFVVASGAGNIVQNGNSFAAPVSIGSNDAFDLNLETTGVERLNVTGGAITGGAFRMTNVTANTNTVQDVLTIRTNSTGAATTGFGGAILFQAETTTTDNRDMVRLSAAWSNGVDANRAGLLIYADATTGGTMTERFRFIGNTMTISSTYTIGASSSQLTIGGSSGLVVISGSGTQGVTINATGATTGRITIGGGVGYTSTTLAKEMMQWVDSYTVASGAGTFTAIAIDNTFNLTGTASGVQRGIDINPTLTSLTAATYRGIDIQYSNAAAYGIYQSGALTRNVFQGVIYFSNEAGGNLPAQATATWELGLDANGKVVIQSVDAGYRVLAAGHPAESKINDVTTDQDYTGIYTIPANYITDNRVIRITLNFEFVTGVSTANVLHYVKLGSTKTYLTNQITNLTNSLTRSASITLLVHGTAAAGAAANVETAITGNLIETGTSSVNTIDQPVALATNGTLSIVPGVAWSSADSLDSMVLRTYLVEGLN